MFWRIGIPRDDPVEVGHLYQFSVWTNYKSILQAYNVYSRYTVKYICFNL